MGKIRPLLDEALARLNKTDRDALLLRFFEQQSLAQVGERLSSNEDAARKRVQRALEKLRALLTQRGVTTTAAALSAVITANAMPAAPAGLALTLTNFSFAAAGTGTLTLLKIMTAAKIKLAFSVLIIASAATALVVQQQTLNKLRAENAAQQQQITELKNDASSLSNQLADAGDSKKLTDEQFNELLKLRGEVGVLRRQTNELGQLREENQRLQATITKPKNVDSNTELPATGQDTIITQTNQLFMRVFKLDLPEFIQNLTNTVPAESGESTIQTLNRLFVQNGFDSPPGTSVFINEPKGLLFVRNTETNLDTIERIVLVLNQ
jgi:hypothetical protein